jgi:hypothetical protein
LQLAEACPTALVPAVVRVVQFADYLSNNTGDTSKLAQWVRRACYEMNPQPLESFRSLTIAAKGDTEGLPVQFAYRLLPFDVDGEGHSQDADATVAAMHVLGLVECASIDKARTGVLLWQLVLCTLAFAID